MLFYFSRHRMYNSVREMKNFCHDCRLLLAKPLLESFCSVFC